MQSGVQKGVHALSLQLAVTLNIVNKDERTLRGGSGGWRGQKTLLSSVNTCVYSHDAQPGQIVTTASGQNTPGCFPTLFILVVLPEGKGIVQNKLFWASLVFVAAQ